MKSLKILVIDDTQAHRDAAIQTLSGNHAVTVCSSHDEARELLNPHYDEGKRGSLMQQYEKEGVMWSEADKRSRKESILSYWDAVLSDLLMPMGTCNTHGEGLKYAGIETPVGWALALQAAKNGAKYVAVVTDMNHHLHPASAMLDPIRENIFNIGKSKMLFTNTVQTVGILGTEKPCEKCNGAGECSRDDGTKYRCCYCEKTGIKCSVWGKDWGRILAELISYEESPE